MNHKNERIRKLEKLLIPQAVTEQQKEDYIKELYSLKGEEVYIQGRLGYSKKNNHITLDDNHSQEVYRSSQPHFLPDNHTRQSKDTPERESEIPLEDSAENIPIKYSPMIMRVEYKPRLRRLIDRLRAYDRGAI